MKIKEILPLVAGSFISAVATRMIDEATGTIVIRRVPNDRGTVVIAGKHREKWMNDMEATCACCGQVGHTSYSGSSIVAMSKSDSGKWVDVGNSSLGDHVYECIHCGASFAALDTWDQRRTYKEIVTQFRRDYPKKRGYRIRFTTEHES